MLGPLWTDVLGIELSASDAELLNHPMVGGVVLFARNFESKAQLCQLTRDIRALRDPPLPIAVDHEGGRVQRFHDGFTRLPPMAEVGALARLTEQHAAAHAAGVIIAYELSACGINLSFVPVMDLSVADNLAIGTRAFAAEPEKVTVLGHALARGLATGGYPAVAKHFPGHGSIVADSHVELPMDQRVLPEVLARDGLPFARWAGCASRGIMTAHIRFPHIDAEAVTFSSFWLRTVLRERLGFDGAIFSDDLGMQAARQMGSVEAAALAAREAGCDVVLVCNDHDAAAAVAGALARQGEGREAAALRHDRMRKFWRVSGEVRRSPVYYEAARVSLASLGLV